MKDDVTDPDGRQHTCCFVLFLLIPGFQIIFLS